VASLHKPVRASGSVAPGVSSLGTVVAQLETSQTTRASLVTILIDGSQIARIATLSRSCHTDNLCHDGNAVKMLRRNQAANPSVRGKSSGFGNPQELAVASTEHGICDSVATHCCLEG